MPEAQRESLERRESPDPSDESLVAAALAGDAAALDNLLRRHEGRVLRLLRLLGVPTRDREDVAQEVLIRVFRHLRGFRSGRSFAAWLYRIGVNAAHDYRRRAARRGRDEEAWSASAERAAGSVPGAAALAERSERRRRLEEALTALSERERAVFVLKELEGLETNDVARALGVTSITVRRHLGLARRRLQAELLRIENPRGTTVSR